MHAALLEREIACTLRSIQNLTFRLRRKLFTNDIDICNAFVKANLYHATIHRQKPFFFGSQTMIGQSLGSSDIGDPLIVGITSMEIILTLRHLSTVGIFCIDSTYSLNNRGFPIVVIGVTDADHSYHPVAFFAVSDEETETYRAVLRALVSIADVHAGIELQPEVVLSDGDSSIRSAVSRLWPGVEHLMCYAHMKRAAERHLKTCVSAEQVKSIMADITRMHDAKSLADFNRISAEASASWPSDVQTYMHRYWLTGNMSKWQLFRGLPEGPHSNQGQESFNRLIKKDFAKRACGKMSQCFEMLMRVARYASTREKPFAITQSQGRKEFLAKGKAKAKAVGKPPTVPTQRAAKKKGKKVATKSK